MTSVGNWNSSKRMAFPEPWYALDPLWEGDEGIIEQGLPHEELAPAWQILILGDFSPTRHLKLLTGQQTEVDIIDISPIGDETDGAPEMIRDVPTPRLRRQVWLCNASRVRLGYAVSCGRQGILTNICRTSLCPFGIIWLLCARKYIERSKKSSTDIQMPLKRNLVRKARFGGAIIPFITKNDPSLLFLRSFLPF